MTGLYKTRNFKPAQVCYSLMTNEEIKKLPVGDLASVGCHLWLWTTNSHLRVAFDVMEAWGFKYLAPITWVKPSGCGNYFIHRTQHLLFGYKDKCQFNLSRYKPNVIFAPVPKVHSRKPEESYQLIESISENPRLEMFARQKREGWDVWGKEVDGGITLFTEGANA